MQTKETPELRARRARLQEEPQDSMACGGCSFYENRTDGEGYCAHPALELNVGASWWCAYYERYQSNAQFAGHPLHPAMIPFPLALTTMALIFDTLALVTGRSFWRREAKHALVAGTATGFLAAPVGLIDWLALPTKRPAKSFGLVHGLGNLLLLALNGVNIGLRNGDNPSISRRSGELGLSLLANLIALATGWLGGELSYRLRVGAEPPSRPYRLLDVEPVVRLPGLPELRDGHYQVPAEAIWEGPVIPSESLPTSSEQNRAAS